MCDRCKNEKHDCYAEAWGEPQSLSNSADAGDYEPFGPEWEKELMKMPKKALIGLIRKIKLGL